MPKEGRKVGNKMADFDFSYAVLVPQSGGQAKLVECESLVVQAVDEDRAREWATGYLGDEFPKGLLLDLTLQSVKEENK